MIALVLVMLQFNPFSTAIPLGGAELPVNFLDIFVYIAGLFTAISGVHYVLDGISQLQARGHGEPIRKEDDTVE
jgi:hypothetical protein